MCLSLCSPLDLRLLKWVTFLLLWLGCKGQRVPARTSRVSGTSVLGVWSGSWREETRVGFNAPPQGDKASSVAAWHRARLQGCRCTSKSDSWLLGLSLVGKMLGTARSCSWKAWTQQLGLQGSEGHLVVTTLAPCFLCSSESLKTGQCLWAQKIWGLDVSMHRW